MSESAAQARAIASGVFGALCAAGTCTAVIICLTGDELFISPDAREASAQDNAVRWAREQGYENPRLSCSGVDGDGDGYVSCTASEAGDDKAVPIECGYDRFFAPAGQNHGCKLVIFAPIGIIP